MSQSILEFKVLALILNRKQYLKYKDFVKLEFFRSRELRLIFKAIVKLQSIKKPAVKTKDIWLLIEKRVDDEDALRYRKILLRMRAQYLAFSNEDEQVLNMTITKFAQENKLRELLQARAQELQAGVDVNIDELQKGVNKIVGLTSTKKVKDYEYGSMTDDRLSKKKEPPRIATGISEELDQAISGGVAAGELAFFLAPTGRGKTLALANVGANALKLGKKVFHVTLEINARAVGKRYDCCLSKSTFEDLRESPELIKKVIVSLKEIGGELIIKDYSYGHCGISELHGLIQERWDEDKKFDLLIVDYADLLAPQEKSNNSRHDLDDIYKELRIIAGYFKIPVWTASQANRVALNIRTITMAQIAESIGKANVADLIIAMCQTDEEVLEKEMRLYVAKNRLGPNKPVVPVMCDPSRMLLGGMSSMDTSQQWLKPKLGQIRKRVKVGMGGGNLSAKKKTTNSRTS